MKVHQTATNFLHEDSHFIIKKKQLFLGFENKATLFQLSNIIKNNFSYKYSVVLYVLNILVILVLFVNGLYFFHLIWSIYFPCVYQLISYSQHCCPFFIIVEIIKFSVWWSVNWKTSYKFLEGLNESIQLIHSRRDYFLCNIV